MDKAKMKFVGQQFVYDVGIPNLIFLTIIMGVGIALAIDPYFLLLALVLRIAGAWFHYSTISKYYNKSVIDPLTNLHNREFNHRELSTLVEQNKEFHFLLLDLDRFKTINDTLGHDVGDKLLQAVAKRLSSCLRDGDVVSRLGGDEFGIVVKGQKFDIQTFCNRIISSIDQPFLIDDYELNLGVSIGIAKFPLHGNSVDTIIKNADAAMYHSKRDKLGYFVFTPELEVIGFENLIVLNDLKTAIVKRQLFNMYQPKIDLISGQVTGIECLCRWNHSKYGLIPPDRFIQIAEQEGLINDLLFLVLENAFRDYSSVLKNGLNLTLSINVSAENLANPEVVAKVISTIAKFDIDPSKLMFEVTETAIVKNLENTIKSLVLLNTFGVKLSVDDFGTGYSSYFYLKHLPISELKIDKSFIDDAIDNIQDYMIVNSIVTLAHSSNCTSVGEGVETFEQAELLEKMGCDCAQGYYFSPPLELHHLIDFCKTFTYKE